MKQRVRWFLVVVVAALSASVLPVPILGQAPDVVDSSVSQEHPQTDTFQPAFSGCAIQTFTPVNSDFEQQVVELVNDHRASIGRPPLKRVSLLNQTARYHARDMREDDYFHHDTYDRVGSNLQFVCGWNIRIGGHYTNAMSLGENIAAGYPTPQSVMNGWLSSPGHRGNIESASYREIGVGYDAFGGNYGHYWVQNFGTRTNVYPLIINREYSRTASPNVSVYVYGTWTQMRLRNDGGPWSNWQPFSNSVNWTLNGIQGSREVCAEFTNGSQTLSACDTISLTVNSPPMLGVTPATLSFIYDLATGQTYPSLPQSVQISNVGNAGALNWTSSADQPWLTATPAGSTLFTTAQVSLVTSALPSTPGAYSGVILFRAPGTSALLTVTLSVVNGLSFKLRMPIVRRS